MTESLKRIQDLSPEQRDLLLRRLAQVDQKSRDRPAELIAGKRGEGVEVPLSFAQESAWFLDRLSPADPAHNITGALRLDGTLAPRALAAALNEIVRRHETLRANFLAPDGEPSQVIHPPEDLRIGWVDLSNLAPAQREAERRRLYGAETRRGFDIARDRLLRAMVVHLTPADNLLLLSMHHIAADGWSIGLLMSELAALYAAFVESRPAALAELPIRYGDFASWQRQRVQAGALDESLDYWRHQLEEPPPILELPPDALPAGTPQSSSGRARERPGATASLHLPAELRQRLKELSRQHDTTLFVTLICAFAALLMRCTGQRDVLIGSPVSGRSRVETEGLIGRFLNTLALRFELSPDLTFRRLVAAGRETVLAAMAHAEMPFERVVQDLEPERSAAGHALFEIVFNFTPSTSRTLELPDLSASFEEPPHRSAQFSMELFVTDWESNLELELLYATALYSEARMAIFLEQLQAVLEQVADDRGRRLGDLDLRTPRSRPLLPDPATALAQPTQEPVPLSILGWAARTPDHPALSQGETTRTYAQLAAAMTTTAELLKQRGLEPEQVVAILGARSPELVASMAGVLLAGGVLLTLSPDLPAERHRLMLEEAGARFLLIFGDGNTEDDALRELGDLEIVELDAGDVFSEGAAAPRSADRAPADAPDTPQARPRSREPAYVFFTSGSTGKPKGVLGTHVGLAHFLAWQRRTFDVGPGDRGGQLTGLSFDVVLRDIFLPLTSGATLVLPRDEDVASGADTLRWLDGERITLLHTVPTLAETWLLDRPPEIDLAALQRIFFAGEPLTASLVERWRQSFPRAGEIVNLYGPTETTLAKCYYRVPARPRAGIQPLGTALPEAQALVLNPQRGQCGVGEPGEIAVRTPFRSLGFINAPEETEKRFIANPFRDDPEDLLYLTGDRGVYGADGLLEFLGRLDHQVKVRGVRVEPAEVAVTLQASSEVATCAVVPRADAPSGPALVAYVVPAPEVEASTGRLQEFLRQRLPAPMVPSAFVFLDSLPLTSNQKLDRDRLPAPSGFRPNLESRYVAPRDAAELRLVQLWEDFLDVRPIGVRDNFFELGGHSLMALNLLVRIDRQLGKKVPLAALFENPTVEHLAEVTRREQGEWPRVVPLWSAEHPLKLFLIHPGGGILWNYVHLVRHLAAEVPVYGLQAKGLDGSSEPHRDIEEMASDYVEEIRRLQSDGPYLLAGHSSGGLVAYEMARQLHLLGHETTLLALFDSALPPPAGDRRSVEDERRQDARSLADMATVIERFTGNELGISYRRLRDLSTDEQLEFVAQALSRSDPLLYGGGTELVRNLLNVSKAHVLARRAYQEKISPSPVPITLVRARDLKRDDPAIPSADVLDEESLGWSAVSSEPVRVLWSPGDHVTMMREPNVKSLAETLRSCLAEAVESAKAHDR